MRAAFLIIILVLFTLGLFGAVVNISFAEEEFHLLTSGVPGLTDTSARDLGTYVSNLFNFGVGIAIALAVIVIVFGGVMYMTTGSINQKNEGREMLNAAILGLVIALGAVVLLNTINPEIKELKFAQSIKKLIDEAKSDTDQGGDGDGGDVTSTPPQANEQAIRDALVLQGGSITINNTCPVGENRSNCTNVGGLPSSTVDGLHQLTRRCGAAVGGDSCAIVITGGTEPGHATHGPGKPAVDLRPSQALNAYIRGGNSADPPHNYRVTRDGVEYTFEKAGQGHSTGDHWHVRF